MAKTIITAALTGAVTPAGYDIPETPEQIAKCAYECWQALLRIRAGRVPLGYPCYPPNVNDTFCLLFNALYVSYSIRPLSWIPPCRSFSASGSSPG